MFIGDLVSGQVARVFLYDVRLHAVFKVCPNMQIHSFISVGVLLWATSTRTCALCTMTISTRVLELISAKRMTKQDAKKMERKAKKNERLGKKIWVEVTSQPEKKRNGKYVGRASFYRQKDKDKKRRSTMINVGNDKAKISIKNKRLWVKPKDKEKEPFFWGDQEKKAKTEGEDPQDYHERVGRCPPGFWWEDGACTIREDAKKIRADRIQRRTGIPSVDKKLARALKTSNPKKKVTGEVEVAKPVDFDTMSLESYDKEGDIAQKRLSKEEQERVFQYTLIGSSDGQNYSDLNNHIRGKKVKHDSEIMDRNVKILSHIIGNARIGQDAKVFRGAESKDMVDQYMNMTPGDEIKSEGFMSTSAKKKISSDFLGDDPKENIMFSINVPKGAPALVLGDMSDITDEAEILLNNDSKFKFVGRKQTDKGLEVVLEYIG